MFWFDFLSDKSKEYALEMEKNFSFSFTISDWSEMTFQWVWSCLVSDVFQALCLNSTKLTSTVREMTLSQSFQIKLIHTINLTHFSHVYFLSVVLMNAFYVT